MKTWQIVLIVVFGVILVFLMIYGLVIMPQKKGGGTINKNTASGGTTPTGSNGSNNGSSNTTMLPKEDIDYLAERFEIAFRIPSGNRCNVIQQANALTPNDLAYFSSYYQSKYNVHPFVPMDDAYYWCFWGSEDEELYEKLKSQLA